DITIVTTQGQDNIDRATSSSQSGNQDEQLACLIQNISERMRQENQPNPPPPPPQQRQDTSESTGEKFRKL
ncbi:hypothetical protein PanWU01x14_354430, partial [Parasponia andersonii]